MIENYSMLFFICKLKVQVRHRNFVSYTRSYVIQSNDVSLHHTSVTFDGHIEEILGTAIMGGQIVILRPYDHLDMQIFSKTIHHYEVTFLGIVPSQMNQLVIFLCNTNEEKNALKSLRLISCGGKSEGLQNCSLKFSFYYN